MGWIERNIEQVGIHKEGLIIWTSRPLVQTFFLFEPAQSSHQGHAEGRRCQGSSSAAGKGCQGWWLLLKILLVGSVWNMVSEGLLWFSNVFSWVFLHFSDVFLGPFHTGTCYQTRRWWDDWMMKEEEKIIAIDCLWRLGSNKFPSTTHFIGPGISGNIFHRCLV